MVREADTCKAREAGTSAYVGNPTPLAASSKVYFASNYFMQKTTYK